MLNKLLKYDLKNMMKHMSIFYILAIIASVTTRIIFSLKQTVIISIVGQISVGFLYAIIANILINTLIRSWVRFIESIYKDESYLTHTLPVSKKDIYNSKFITAVITLFISIVVIIISLLITYYTKERWDMLVSFIKPFITGVDINFSVAVILVLLLVYLEIFNGIQAGFLGIIIGNKQNNYKTLFSIAFGFVTYFLTQSVVLLIEFIYGLFDKSILDMFHNTNITSFSSFKTLMIIAIISYFVVIIIVSIICKVLLNKGVNVE